MHFNIFLFHTLYLTSIFGLYIFHCTWLRCIRNFTKDLSHGFLISRWLVHSQCMDLDNSFKVVMHYLLIGKITSLGHQDGFPMVSPLVCIVAHWIRPKMNHDIRLSSCHEFTKLLYCIVSQPWKNIKLVSKLIVVLTYG